MRTYLLELIIRKITFISKCIPNTSKIEMRELIFSTATFAGIHSLKLCSFKFIQKITLNIQYMKCLIDFQERRMKTGGEK